MNIDKFTKTPILGIVRGITSDSLPGTFQAAIEAGFAAIEITMNTPDAALLLHQAVNKFSERILIGAGTVTNIESMKKALSSGASFIVTPVFDKDISHYCTTQNIPIFPGALSPSEIYHAYQSGATMIKVFPAETFGPRYFKCIKGPFQDIPLMAVGGVSLENMKEYFTCGASAVATGTSVFKKDWMKEKNFDAIYTTGKAYVEKVRECVSGALSC